MFFVIRLGFFAVISVCVFFRFASLDHTEPSARFVLVFCRNFRRHCLFPRIFFYTFRDNFLRLFQKSAHLHLYMFLYYFDRIYLRYVFHQHHIIEFIGMHEFFRIRAYQLRTIFSEIIIFLTQ